MCKHIGAYSANVPSWENSVPNAGRHIVQFEAANSSGADFLLRIRSKHLRGLTGARIILSARIPLIVEIS